jgi:hypothetical protein
MSEDHKREEERYSPPSSPRGAIKQGPNRNFVVLVGAVIFSFIICASFLAAADSSPILPARFYGNVTINDQPAPAGTLVTAVVQGGGGNITTTVPGRYGSTYFTDPRFEVQGQISDGAPISFFVNGVPAECYPVTTHGPWQGTYPFYADEEINLDLRAEGEMWTIVASAGAGGSISPSGNVPVVDDADQSFSITPVNCYRIFDVLVDSSSVGPVSSYTFYDVGANHTIAASFQHITYTLSGSAGTGGSITPQGNITVPCGGSQDFTVTPENCYQIANVFVNGNSVGALPVVTLTDIHQNYSVEAVFAPIIYTISSSAGTGGSIAPPGDIPVACGDDQSFTISPDSCHYIGDVRVDGSSVGPVSSYTFDDVDQDHTIAAEFTAITYTIVSSAGSGGAISPSGEGEFPCGSDQTFTITPDPCSMVSDVLVDGESVGAVDSYTFYGLDDDHTITAEFSPITYAIEATAGPGGSIFPEGTVLVPCGSSRLFLITPESGFHIEDVVVDDVSQGVVSSYTFSSVHENHTIEAYFAEGGPVFFTETLYGGWNLFSTPILLEPGHRNLDEVFLPDQLENIDMILAWSGSYWYIPTGDYSVDPLYAVYVKVRQNESATAEIYPSTSVSSLPARYLQSGLSLIGPAPAYDGGPFPTMQVDQAFISIKEAPGNLTGYTMVISPGLGQPAWVYVQGAPVQSVLPFRGYWVVMENPDTLFGFSTTPIA